ncbi:TonB-dependent receptor [Flavobacterium sp.]|uniref:SusC/RagA family TonB-linked outer membrane protein n=1 Tax=Flavobacterium sp. TaxID=239 RepID=UPI002B5A0948|nr:TonB-dependent receptor [Flavobacterium sp.]HSD06590.1 TonB-dependent receptor [Flavobacterium sp.]
MIVKSVFKKSKRISFVLMLLMSLLTSNIISAQNAKSISGVVKDELGMPLPGVNIAEKGTKNSASSDFDGKFTIKVSGNNAVLLFSFIGYESKSVNAAGKTTLNVSLNPSAESLSEVKIVSYGYGTIKKENLTGSVASISAKELSKVPVSNVTEALAGRLAGVSVQSVDGAPGGDIVIRVRGGGSITQDNSPLYIVDGFVVSNLNDIPPGDITSIDVLKDAATTAIYGAQGANGVVVVTTKKPKAGRTTVTYNNYVQISTMPQERKYEVLSPYEFATMQYETAKMSTTSSANTALDNFEKYYGKFDDLELYKYKKANDWQDDVLGNSVVSYYNNLSISGGSESTSFLISYSANNDGGLLLGSGQKRDVINFKLTHDITKKLKLDLNSRIANRVVNGAGTSGSSQIKIKDLITKRPTNGIADELDMSGGGGASTDDDYEQFLTTFIDPVELVKQDWRKKSLRTYSYSAGLTWNIDNHFTAKSILANERSFGENLRFYGPLTGESKNNGNSLPLGVKSDIEAFSYRFTNTLNYDFKNIGKHALNLLVGQEIRSKGSKSQEVRAEDFRASITPAELFANMNLGTTAYQKTYEDTDENMSSFFGRADYSFNDRYLFTATIRRDASSKFQGSNAVGVFPAFSAGWKISSESFMKESKVFDELKLRIGYGETGNDRIPANSTILIFKSDIPNGPGFGNNTENVYYTPDGTVLFNPDLKWETTINRNIGLDFRLFKSVINGSIDVYKNTTEDLLLKSTIPLVSGFAEKWDNIGNTTNQGIEAALNANIINKKDYSLSINFNFGINKSKIDKLDGTNDRYFQSNWASTDLKEQNDYYIAVGQSIGQIVGYSNAGMYSVDDFEQVTPTTYKLKSGVPDASSLLNATVKPGSMKIADSNGDGVIDEKDAHVIGNALAKAQGGFGLSGTYKAFDISAFFNWSYGGDVYNTGKVDYNQLYRTTYGNMLNTMNSANRFTYIDMDGTYTGTPGEVVTDLAQLGEMNKGKTMWSGNTSFGGSRAVLTDWAIEDASFIRLNNLTIGYTLPVKEFKKPIFSSLRLYVTGSNLALWTKYSGYDPDVNTSRNSDSGGFSGLTPGLDYSSYPRSRTFTFGVNVTF